MGAGLCGVAAEGLEGEALPAFDGLLPAAPRVSSRHAARATGGERRAALLRQRLQAKPTVCFSVCPMTRIRGRGCFTAWISAIK